MYSSAIAVELGRRMPGSSSSLEQRERLGDDLAGARHQLDLAAALLRMIMRAHLDLLERVAGSRRRPRRPSASACSGTSLPVDAVVLDDRLGLGVVDREAPRDHLRRVVGAALVAARAEHPLGARRRPEGRRRGSRRAPRPIPASITSSASACARLRGKPSRTKPSRASSSPSRSRISAIVSSSGTSSPAARIGSTCWPSSVPRGDRGAEHVAGRRRAGSRTRPRSASPASPCRPPAGRGRAGSLRRKPS